MNISEVISSELVSSIRDVNAIGIDIGSRQAKAVLINRSGLHTAITSSGVDAQETADRLIKKLARSSGIQRSDIAFAVGTGYGRVAIEFPEFSSVMITEISCHAMGAHYLHAPTRTIIDIGGQDAKAIKIDPNDGRVLEFIMNDKCAAGTGRFLERIAELLDYRLEDLGPKSLLATNKIQISSQCVVFGESEVISLKAKGERTEDIAAGIHVAAARRVRNLINRLGLEPDLVFTGGVANNIGMKQALEELIGHAITVPKLDMVYAGALGAAVLAQRKYEGGKN